MSPETPSKHKDLYEVLERRILSGEWAIGDQIPTEMELAAEFSCSRSTVGKSIARLVHEGLVERRTRTGTRVIRQSLNRGNSGVDLNAFAFIYPSRQHDGIWRAVSGFQAAAQKASRRVMMLSTEADYAKEHEFIARLAEFDVRAAAIFPVFSTPEQVLDFSRMILNSRFPTVIVQVSVPGLSRPSIVLDAFHSGYITTKHLITRGVRDIGFFSNYSWELGMQDRYKGFCWAMEEAGLQPRPEAVLRDPRIHPNFEDPLAEPTALARIYFERAGRVGGVVCADTYLALGCIAAAREIGLSTPRDFEIVSGDDYRVPGMPSMTSYVIPYEEIGRRAFATLEALTNKNAQLPPETSVRGELLVRDSA